MERGFWVVYISMGISKESTGICCYQDVKWAGEGYCHGVGMRK